MRPLVSADNRVRREWALLPERQLSDARAVAQAALALPRPVVPSWDVQRKASPVGRGDPPQPATRAVLLEDEPLQLNSAYTPAQPAPASCGSGSVAVAVDTALTTP